MPYRRMFSKRPINSQKHVLDVEGALSGGTKSVSTVLLGVAAPSNPFVPGDVPFGSRVSSLFLSIFMIGASGSGQDGSLNWYIAKLRNGQSSGEFPNPGETGVSQVRNQIFHEEKGLAGSADGTPMAFKGVVRVPPSMQRVREGDQLHIVLRSTDITNNVNFCIKAIYKSYQ